MLHRQRLPGIASQDDGRRTSATQRNASRSSVFEDLPDLAGDWPAVRGGSGKGIVEVWLPMVYDGTAIGCLVTFSWVTEVLGAKIGVHRSSLGFRCDIRHDDQQITFCSG